MIDTGRLTSSLVLNQLPEHIRDNPDYANFHTFLKAYYEWMEQTGKVSDRTQNLLSYKDVDSTTDEFLDYFTNDFLPFFPKDTLLSKEETVKVARQLYQTKGTPASYEFLFRILYNSEFEVFNTKDAVFKASSGTWYVTKSLKLSSSNPKFLRTKELRVFGEESKSIATIEACVLSGNKVEVFISNIERLFRSGEMVRIVDSYNQDVLFDGELLRAKIVGQISQIKVTPTNRGSLYQPGDPVVVYDGLDSPDGLGASAKIAETTKGSIQRINVVNGGFGYTLKPNTKIQVVNGGGAKANVYSLTYFLPPSYKVVTAGTGYRVNDRVNYNNSTIGYVTQVDGYGAIQAMKYINSVNAQAIVGITTEVVSSNTQASGAVIKTSTAPGNSRANVSYIPTDVIGFKANTVIGNTNLFFANNMVSVNANTTLINALSFITLETSSLESIIVENGGGGISTIPDIVITSTIPTEDEFNDYEAASADIAPLGILAPIQVILGGTGYEVDDTVEIVGGSGRGAYANVTSVDSNGAITSVEYVFNPADDFAKYPLGGLGYKNEFLPTATVVSANNDASGAILSVPGTLGTGAEFSLVVDRVGSVTSVNIIDAGEDYDTQPGVSLKIQDIVVSNVSIENLPVKGEYIYQGPSLNLSSYAARVNSVSLLATDIEPSKSLYNLQVFNYNSNPKPELELKIYGDTRNINLLMANSAFPQFQKVYNHFDSLGNRTIYTRDYNKQGFITYGDGSAKANATFLNGLVIGDGQYLTTQGQPSSFDIMQNDRFNNFTYMLTVQKEISKYREVLLGLLHPLGTNVMGRYGLKSNNNLALSGSEALYTGRTLSYYLGADITDAITIATDFDNKSNNIIKFNNVLGANIAGFITPNVSSIEIKNEHGSNVRSLIVAVNENNNTITLESNVWLTFANVAVVTGNSGSNILNISSLTDAYDTVNNGNYSDSDYPIRDIVFVGDSILVDNNTSKVVSTVDYINGRITLASNLSSNTNSYLAVNRKFIANSSINSSQIKIYGPNGIQYIPELATEDGYTITTEDGYTILLG